MDWWPIWLVVALALVLLLNAAGYFSYRRRLARIERTLSGLPHVGGPDARRLDALPKAARQMLEHMIAPNAPAVRAVRFRLDGEIQPAKGGKWLPIRSVELLRVPGGFTWRAATQGPMTLLGGDHYLGNAGGVNFWLFGLFHIVRSKGPDVMRSARGRAACEAMWFPPALLSAEWLGAEKPTCRLQVDDEDFTLEFEIAGNGRILTVCGERWSNQGEGGAWQKLKFGAEFTAEATVGGYTIPTDFTAGWHFGTPAWETGKFFRARLSEIEWLT